MARKDKIDVSGGDDLGVNPFGNLDLGELPEGPGRVEETIVHKKVTQHGKIVVRKEKSGRGGKVVTVVTGLERELEVLLKDLKVRLGVGGALKNGSIEVQGDKRTEVAAYLEEIGYRVVVSGG